LKEKMKSLLTLVFVLLLSSICMVVDSYPIFSPTFELNAIYELGSVFYATDSINNRTYWRLNVTGSDLLEFWVFRNNNFDSYGDLWQYGSGACNYWLCNLFFLYQQCGSVYEFLNIPITYNVRM